MKFSVRYLFTSIFMFFSCVFAQAQNVTIKSGDQVCYTTNTIFDALQKLEDHTSSVAPDANGVIRIEISGPVTETKICAGRGAAEGDIIRIKNTNTKKLVFTSAGSAKQKVSHADVDVNDLNKCTTYRIVFSCSSEAEIEAYNLEFTNAFSWVASFGRTGAPKATTYFHDCLFDGSKVVYKGAIYTVNNADAEYQSDEYIFTDNVFEDAGWSYAFRNQNYGYPINKLTKVIFNDNVCNRFRALSVFTGNAEGGMSPGVFNPVDVTMKGNKLYHLVDYTSYDDCTDCSLCQVTGPIYGEYVIEDNIILGFFTPGGEVTYPSVMMQHGNNSYKGIKSTAQKTSSISIKNNITQCDVLYVGFKGGEGSGYPNEDVTAQVKAGTYKKLWGEPGDPGSYTATIDDETAMRVHMYSKENASEHSDSDACHICYACGQMVLRAEVQGHGGTFQYKGSDGQMHNVSDASVTIANNIYPSDVKPGANLYEKIVHNVVRDGFCLDPGKSQEFVITPTIKGDFKKLELLGGPTSPKDVTASAITTDEGKTYKYTYTNDFTQKAPYTACPHLIATIGHVSISIKCEGLVAGESALFDVKDNAGKVLFVVSLNSEHPKKTVSGLEAGEYTIVPHNGNGHDWQWTYTMDPSSPQSSTITVAEGEHTFEFTATKGKPSVKNGENYKDNTLSSSNTNGGINKWNTPQGYDL